MFSGIPISVSSYICEYPFLYWKANKTHRRSRIRKKWLKRYGRTAIYGPCPGKAFKLRGMGLVVCPHIKAELDKTTEKMKTAPIIPYTLLNTF